MNTKVETFILLIPYQKFANLHVYSPTDQDIGLDSTNQKPQEM